MRIGLLGGTFNPPHEGHLLVSETALRRLELDRVWWIVTPGNPLKNNAALPPLASRMALAQTLANEPRIDVTGFEAAIGTTYTYETLAYLRRRLPATRFVWLMGADNLLGFHRWRQWRDIASLMPIAVIDRPGATLKATRSPAAAALAPRRMDESDAPLLAGAQAPAWVFLHGRRSHQSSTALRAMAGRPVRKD